MIVYKHISNRGRVAVTQDPAGSSLPTSAETWTPSNTVDIQPGEPYIGKSGDQILADIKNKGFSAIPDDLKP